MGKMLTLQAHLESKGLICAVQSTCITRPPSERTMIPHHVGHCLGQLTPLKHQRNVQQASIQVTRAFTLLSKQNNSTCASQYHQEATCANCQLQILDRKLRVLFLYLPIEAPNAAPTLAPFTTLFTHLLSSAPIAC